MTGFDYPNMISEVMEAIHLMYEDQPDVEIDCMLYLSHIVEGSNYNLVSKWFTQHDRCEDCGAPMEHYVIRYPHFELEGTPYETLNESCCPNCDEIKGGT